MGVEFRIFGDVVADHDGRRLDIGHARQSFVLAALLVDVNRPVTADHLIDRVWADRPPHSARNALAAYVSRLRHALAVVDGVTIVRGTVGYTLAADPLSVDLHRFRQSVAEARALSDPGSAADRFDDALGLWRGDPFAALDTPWAQGQRAALKNERSAAVVDRFEAAIAAGRHAAVLPDLYTAVAESPLDERLAGQLMLALYRCGRQADALATYREMRQRLVDELGVDPSEALDAVHRRILEGAAGAITVAAPTALVERASTGVVPRRTRRLVGREADVARVVAAVDEHTVVTLTGVGGVGKTRLALEVAEQLKGRFPGGRWVSELAPLSDGAAVGHAVAAALRSPLGGSIDSVVKFLRDRELLLVVDNCEHVIADVAALVDRVATECRGVSVLATSREPLGITGERVVPVPPLSQRDAAELFIERARASRPGFDPEREAIGAVAEICRRLDGVPLAIELAASRTRAMSSLDIARRLDRLRLLTGGPRGAHPRQQSVEATIDWSYRLLTAAEQTLFARLSVFAGGFDLEAAHAVCGEPNSSDDDMLDLLTGLVDKSMVTVGSDTGTTRYGLLETLRAYGRQHTTGCDDEIAARHARYYSDLIEQAAAGVQGPDEREWVERITPNAGTTYAAPDFDNIRTAFEYAVDHRDIDIALRIVTSLLEPIHLRAGFHDFGWLQRAIAIADPEHPRYVEAVTTAARGMWTGCEFGRARALLATVAGREPAPGAAFLAIPSDLLADIAIYDGDVRGVLSHSRAVAEQLRTADTEHDPRRHVMTLDRITICHRILNCEDTGLAEAREAVLIAEGTGNPSLRALALCALGRASARMDPDGARAAFTAALQLATSVENNWLIGVSRTECAAIQAHHGDPAVAARELLDVIDHWARGGPGVVPMQRDALTQAVRLLYRVGAQDAARRLHRAFVAAGWRAPLPAVEAGDDGPLVAVTDVEILEMARSALKEYC